jgi:lysophospholipase L1-like esterase
MKKKILLFTVTLFSTGFYACKTNLSQSDVSAGSADFKRYVAIGNSLTAGMGDGALYREGQDNSYPKMLSEQFKLAGGGAFNIPYMDDGGGNDGSDNPRRILGFVIPCNSNTPALSPVYDPAGSTALNKPLNEGPYNLIGVPGARAIDANLGLYSFLNPFLRRFCVSPGVSTMLSEAMRANPTFFTMWLGSNDVLAYALAGAVPQVNILSPALSDTASLRSALTLIADSLTHFGAKGAIANVPDVTSVPYFNTIPWNGVVLSKGKADTLNGIYQLSNLPGITWHEGANGFLIVDSSAAPYVRHATAGDLILLSTPSDSLKCGQWGVSPARPLGDAYVLEAGEIALIQLYTTKYNETIRNIATQYGLALVDINTYLKSVLSGITYNGINLNATFVTGGAFSLDGVHPNPRGYAMIANEFIRSINAKYGSTIPYVDATKYRGILFP